MLVKLLSTRKEIGNTPAIPIGSDSVHTSHVVTEDHSLLEVVLPHFTIDIGTQHPVLEVVGNVLEHSNILGRINNPCCGSN